MSRNQLDRIESILQAIAHKLGVKTDSFNPSEYLEYDIVKNLIIEHLECKGYVAYINPDKYGIDLLARKNGHLFYFEIEVKNWSFTGQHDFPFETVHFTNRKKKFGNDFHYIIINKENTYALIADSRQIFRPENLIIKQVNRNGLNADEQFYSLPKDKVRFFKLAKKDETVKQ
jgi:hypothetical protein